MEQTFDTPKVSVLIPTYNYGKFLRETIISILDQTYSNFELIVVDNNSTDETDVIVQEFFGIKNFYYFKNTKNLGMSGNWNRCLQVAKGKYIKFVCADDKLHPENLSEFVSILDHKPNISIVSSFFKYFGDTDDLIRYPFEGEVKGKDIVRYNLLNHNVVGTPTQVMFRANTLWVGTFKSELLWINDTDMWNRLLMQGDYYCIPQILSYVRSHSEQATVSVIKNFSAAIDGYNYMKYIEMTNQFNIDNYSSEFDKALKNKAFELGKLIPSILLSKRYDLIKKVRRILFFEGVITRSLVYFSKFCISSIFKRIKTVFK